MTDDMMDLRALVERTPRYGFATRDDWLCGSASDGAGGRPSDRGRLRREDAGAAGPGKENSNWLGGRSDADRDQSSAPAHDMKQLHGATAGVA